MSFKEAVVVPLETYNRCRPDRSDKALSLLTSDTLPPDEKLKLYHQMRVLKKSRKTPSASGQLARDKREHIVSNFPEKSRPIVGALLDKIVKSGSEIGWDEDMRVLLDGTPVSDSNLISILLYFTKDLVVSGVRDIPVGSRAVYDKLLTLGTPKSWIPREPPVVGRSGLGKSPPSTPVSARKKKKRGKSAASVWTALHS